MPASNAVTADRPPDRGRRRNKIADNSSRPRNAEHTFISQISVSLARIVENRRILMVDFADALAQLRDGKGRLDELRSNLLVDSHEFDDLAGEMAARTDPPITLVRGRLVAPRRCWFPRVNAVLI